MKDVIRRGVDRQVAEGMFERAQERMQHQFQQLKVFIPPHSLHSSPKEAPGGGGGRKPAQEMGEVVVIWAEVESDVFRKVGPTKAHGARRGGQLALGILPSLPVCDGVSLLSGAVTSEMRPLQPSPASFPFSK